MEMNLPMTCTAQGDQICCNIASEMTSPLYMMDLQNLRASTLLASPAVAREHLPTKVTIGLLVEPDSRLSRAE